MAFTWPGPWLHGGIPLGSSSHRGRRLELWRKGCAVRLLLRGTESRRCLAHRPKATCTVLRPCCAERPWSGPTLARLLGTHPWRLRPCLQFTEQTLSASRHPAGLARATCAIIMQTHQSILLFKSIVSKFVNLRKEVLVKILVIHASKAATGLGLQIW